MIQRKPGNPYLTLPAPDWLIEQSMKDVTLRDFALYELKMMEAAGIRPEFVARMRAIKCDLPEGMDFRVPDE